MCGRYIANSEDEIMEIREILKQISLRLTFTDAQCAPLQEIFPTNEVMFITSAFEFIRGRFGLEKWDKKGVIINARSENYESNFFRQFARNRCIIPAHGYYEWQTLPNKKKIKYAFVGRDTLGAPSKHGIFMAGIHNKNNEFAVITKPAGEEIEFIHPRMPLIIKAEQAEDWLSGKANVRELVKQTSGVSFEETG
ncbi:MAG: SOS response-associated peptidase [Oscillospiraceae bacterium]|jgi:putative SOS response-associated peptidase YedK|nr:SOS response-associated peptidase [Oscillospiraceae bacterium]